MFENYRELSAEKKEEIKRFHVEFRAFCKEYGRYGNLAWGFVRGFPYRRIERSHRVQKENGFIHNMPSESFLLKTLHRHSMLLDVTMEEINRWLANPEGAIPAPPPRERAPRKAAE